MKEVNYIEGHQQWVSGNTTLKLFPCNIHQNVTCTSIRLDASTIYEFLGGAFSFHLNWTNKFYYFLFRRLPPFFWEVKATHCIWHHDEYFVSKISLFCSRWQDKKLFLLMICILILVHRHFPIPFYISCLLHGNFEDIWIYQPKLCR